MTSPKTLKSLSFKSLHDQIIHCHHCPRLREHCQEIARIKRRAYTDQVYWGKPISGFGDLSAEVIIVGLAPGAHGANRTGRVFTGDRSGDWLYRALYKAGFANQLQSTDIKDGLHLKNAYITCVVKCAPPDNKPTPSEIKICSEYLKKEIQILKNAKVWIALGQISLHTLWPILTLQTGVNHRRPAFKHGEALRLSSNQWLLMSYHPSQQNTFTGKLTEPMFDHVFEQAKQILFE